MPVDNIRDQEVIELLLTENVGNNFVANLYHHRLTHINVIHDIGILYIFVLFQSGISPKTVELRDLWSRQWFNIVYRIFLVRTGWN